MEKSKQRNLGVKSESLGKSYPKLPVKMHKAWKKPLHKRKLWTQISWTGRLVYYMQPLMQHLVDIWLHQVPFPTLFKGMYSCVLIALLLMPVIYPMTVLGLYYSIYQFIGEKHFNVTFPQNLNLIGVASDIWSFQITEKKHILFLSMYIDRYRVLLTCVSSIVDYLRMALCFAFG